jgi:putative phosphoesterase
MEWYVSDSIEGLPVSSQPTNFMIVMAAFATSAARTTDLLEPIDRNSNRPIKILSGTERANQGSPSRSVGMLVLSDTHRAEGHGLTDHLRETVAAADRVVHAGDFTTPAVLSALREVAPRVDAVHGNADAPALRSDLPAERTLTYGGVRIAVTHRANGGRTGLTMVGRAADAALVVSGHTHRPTVVDGEPTLLNPGSHADPRGNRPGYARLTPEDGGLVGELRDPDGTRIERFRVDG